MPSAGHRPPAAGAVTPDHPAASLEAQQGGPSPLPRDAHRPEKCTRAQTAHGPAPSSLLSRETNHGVPSQHKSPRLSLGSLECFGQSLDRGQSCASLGTARHLSCCRRVIFHRCFPSARVLAGGWVAVAGHPICLSLCRHKRGWQPRHKSPSTDSLPSKLPQTFLLLITGCALQLAGV